MNVEEKQQVLDALNNMEVIESNGGEDAYIIVENNEKIRAELNELGISNETIRSYGDEETFCVLSLAFSEGYCDLHDGNKLIAFDKSVTIEYGDGSEAIMYMRNGDYHLAIDDSHGGFSVIKLLEGQVESIREFIN